MPSVFKRPDIVWNFTMALFRGPLLATLFTVLTFPAWRFLVRHGSGLIVTNYAIGDGGGGEEGTRGWWSPAGIFTISMFFARFPLLLGWLVFSVLCDRYKFLERYKIHKNFSLSKNIPASLHWRTAKHILLQHCIIQPGVFYTCAHFLGVGVSIDPLADLPESFLEIYFRFWIKNFMNDIVFFLLHGMLHYFRPLYKKYHNVHHEYNQSWFISADFAHPHETWIFVLLPTILQCAEGRDHMYLYIVYFAWRVYQNYELHSGYSFEGSWPAEYLGLLHPMCSKFHEFHHNANKGYGVSMMTDYLAGTMDDFMEAHPPPPQKKRR